MKALLRLFAPAFTVLPAALLWSGGAMAQSANQNYVKTTTVLVPGITTPAQVDALNLLTQKSQAVSYVDGLGRSLQAIDQMASPSGADVVSFHAYNAYGEELKTYLPFTKAQSSSGAFVSNPTGDLTAFYTPGSMMQNGYATTAAPWAEVEVERSPLARPKEQSAPGEAWQLVKDANGNSTGAGHTVKSTWRVNTAADDYRQWSLDASGNILASPALYAPGTLMIATSVDENGNPTRSVSDREGRTIASETDVDNTVARTMYVYDALGRLRVAIQPEGWKLIKNNGYVIPAGALDKFAFQYTYDGRGRVIKKKVPGADWVHMVYDKLDRVVLTQDGNQRAGNDWTFTKYDVFGRVLMTGLWKNPVNRTHDQLRSDFAGTTAPLYERRPTSGAWQHGYTNQALPNLSNAAEYELYAVTYYDDYNTDASTTTVSGAPAGSGFDVWYQTDTDYPNLSEIVAYPTGKATVVKVRILNPATDMPDWLITSSFYDKYGRVLQTRSGNHLSAAYPVPNTVIPETVYGYDIQSNDVDFTGKTLKTKLIHVRPLPGTFTGNIRKREVHTTRRRFEYDHRGRLLKTWQRVDVEQPGMVLSGRTLVPGQQTFVGTEVLLSSLRYNELGQVVEKNLHSTDLGAHFLQSLDMAYNVRGWLTNINTLNYTDGVCASSGGGGGMSLNMERSIGGQPVEQTADSLTDVVLEGIALRLRTAYEQGQWVVYGTVSDSKTGTYEKTTDPEALEGTGTTRTEDISQSSNSVYLLTLADSLNTALTDSIGLALFNLSVQPEEVATYRETLETLILNALSASFTASGLSATEQEEVVETLARAAAQEAGNVWEDDDQHDLFALELSYEQEVGETSLSLLQPQYNGNISAMKWQTARQACKVQRYAYAYDGMNRLLAGQYQEHQSNGLGRNWGYASGMYNVAPMTYDLNGNILGLQRAGLQGTVDMLTYTYDGNRLKKVEDAAPVTGAEDFKDGAHTATEYTYDANGNIISDANKGITSIVYNAMNKPVQITFANGGTIAYLYSMDGTKLRQTVTPSGGTAEKTDYSNGFLYRNAALTEFAQPEGRITSSSMEGLVLSYEYYLKDHLGNIRVVAGDADGDGIPEVLQEDAYDPWGLRLQGYGFVSGEENRFRYNGKELITALGLGWYDYGARMYAPDLGRWNGVDPLAEKASFFTSYGYVYNNPIMLIDPDGRQARYNWETKKYEDRDRYGNPVEVSWEDVQRQYGMGGAAQSSYYVSTEGNFLGVGGVPSDVSAVRVIDANKFSTITAKDRKERAGLPFAKETQVKLLKNSWNILEYGMGFDACQMVSLNTAFDKIYMISKEYGANFSPPYPQFAYQHYSCPVPDWEIKYVENPSLEIVYRSKNNQIFNLKYGNVTFVPLKDFRTPKDRNYGTIHNVTKWDSGDPRVPITTAFFSTASAHSEGVIYSNGLLSASEAVPISPKQKQLYQPAKQ